MSLRLLDTVTVSLLVLVVICVAKQRQLIHQHFILIPNVRVSASTHFLDLAIVDDYCERLAGYATGSSRRVVPVAAEPSRWTVQSHV